MTPSGSKLLWEQQFSKNIPDLEWEKICGRTNAINLCTKLRLFQYKILQRCLVTNVHLFYYKIKSDSLCTFCKQERETIIHLLWECRLVKPFWAKLAWRIKNILKDDRMSSSSEKVIFNTIVSDPRNLLNVLILIAKRHIYVSRCYQIKPNIGQFWLLVDQLCKIEEHIAYKNSNFNKHESKWLPFINVKDQLVSL